VGDDEGMASNEWVNVDGVKGQRWREGGSGLCTPDRTVDSDERQCLMREIRQRQVEKNAERRTS
jgi:hypothetical protein